MISTSHPCRFLLAAAAACLVAAVHPAAAQPVTVDVTIDASPGGTRVLLTHSEPVVHVINASDDRIEIHYAKPLELRPEGTQRFEGEILERLRLRGRRTLVLNTGPAYGRYESFELRNPFRLIIDLHGRDAPTAERPDLDLAPPPPRRVIVIDPGHGGIEHGAIGPTGLQEKDVALELARRLRFKLQRAYPSLGVVLTRDEDRLVGLDERTAIANHNRAELFLSIHLNASPRTGASGAETYFLSSDATDDEARLLAGLENRASGVKQGSIRSDGAARRDLDLVLWDLAQNRYLDESGRLAESVQQQLNRVTGTRDRGIRQAPFRVLMGATMPAILVEVGFISNPEEEVRFRTVEYRDQVAEAISAAVGEFLLGLEQWNPTSSLDSGTEAP